MKKCRILIANDSQVDAAILKAVIETEPDWQVVGVARTGVECLAMAIQEMPDAILMDIYMPEMDGVEAVRRIMATHPRPILLATALSSGNLAPLFDALKAGALDYVRTPMLSHPPGSIVTRQELRQAGRELLEKMRLLLLLDGKNRLASVPPQEPWEFGGDGQGGRGRSRLPLSMIQPILAIGCSTGGPTSLATLLYHLPRAFPVPILICQHLDPVFGHGLAEWLAQETGFSADLVRHGERPQANKVYLAPGDRNLVLAADGRLLLEVPAADCHYLPNVDRLFFSLAANHAAATCVVVLTGMGEDGAKGAAAVRAAGGCVLVQDEESAVIPSMPRSARLSAGLTVGFPPKALAGRITTWLRELLAGDRL